MKKGERKQACKHGHPLDGPEAEVRVHIRPTGKSERVCKICIRENRRIFDLLRKARRSHV